jgi:hypothetical protein
MADVNFYTRPDSQKHLDKYKKLKGKLEIVMTEWESVRDMM